VVRLPPEIRFEKQHLGGTTWAYKGYGKDLRQILTHQLSACLAAFRHW